VRVPEFLNALAVHVDGLLAQRDRIVVGIDGPDAAGKSTFADSLSDRLGTSTVRASIDGFHHPRAVRRRRGELSTGELPVVRRVRPWPSPGPWTARR
jgi:uridine kinase